MDIIKYLFHKKKTRVQHQCGSGVGRGQVEEGSKEMNKKTSRKFKQTGLAFPYFFEKWIFSSVLRESPA